MLSRRTLFGSLAGLVATLPFARRAFAEPGLTPYEGEYHTPSHDTRFLELPPPIRIKEGFLDIVLDGEVHQVHRIEMVILDGADRSGGMGLLFGAPNDRRVVLPLFKHDPEAGDPSLEHRLLELRNTFRERGYDSNYVPFEEEHLTWITQTGPAFDTPMHAMGCTPYELTLENMHLIAPVRMVRHERVDTLDYRHFHLREEV